MSASSSALRQVVSQFLAPDATEMRMDKFMPLSAQTHHDSQHRQRSQNRHKLTLGPNFFLAPQAAILSPLGSSGESALARDSCRRALATSCPTFLCPPFLWQVVANALGPLNQVAHLAPRDSSRKRRWLARLIGLQRGPPIADSARVHRHVCLQAQCPGVACPCETPASTFAE